MGRGASSGLRLALGLHLVRPGIAVQHRGLPRKERNMEGSTFAPCFHHMAFTSLLAAPLALLASSIREPGGLMVQSLLFKTRDL